MLEGVKRRASMCQAFYNTFSVRERYIVSVSSNFLTQILHGTRTKCRKTRAKLKILQYMLSLALKQLRHLAVRVKPISFALRACFLGHYRMARMSQSASPCGLASWMGPHMVPDAHLLKLLFLARYTHRSIRILHISTNIVLPTYFLDVPFYNILHINTIFATHLLPFLSIKNSNILIQ